MMYTCVLDCQVRQNLQFFQEKLPVASNKHCKFYHLEADHWFLSEHFGGTS